MSVEKIFRGSPRYYEKVANVIFGNNKLDFLSLNLPPICNYHCNFCFSSNTSNNPELLKKARENTLTFEEYTSILQQAKALGVRHLEISGEGEPDFPLFRNTLEHIIREASRLNIHTTLFTNGSWLNEKRLEFIKNNNASLVISIKYLNQEKYDHAVKINGSFNKVIKNIELAQDILGGNIEENNYQIYRLALFGAVLGDNQQDIEELRNYCDQHDLFFSLSSLIPQGNSAGAYVDCEAQENIVKQFSHSSMILADSSQQSTGKEVCGTFYYGIGINYDGEVVFDAHASDAVGLIGNIRTLNLARAVTQQRVIRDLFYQQFGQCYCPLRDPSYANFIAYLKRNETTANPV